MHLHIGILIYHASKRSCVPQNSYSLVNLTKVIKMGELLELINITLFLLCLSNTNT